LTPHNENWDLRSFVEAVTSELDRAQDILRVKSLNRPLTYSVQDLKLNLNVFAEYDGDSVRFRTAEPGEQGASQMEFKLGSITDRMVAETTRPLPTAEDVPLEELAETNIEPEQRRTLKRLGVDSKRDIERLAKRQVRVGGVDFAALAEQMDRATRPRLRPTIRRVAGFQSPSGALVRLFGQNLDEIRPGTVRIDGLPVEATVRPDVLQLTLEGPSPSGELCFDTAGGETLRVQLVES
jgi:hypothetical protein